MEWEQTASTHRWGSPKSWNTTTVRRSGEKPKKTSGIVLSRLIRALEFEIFAEDRPPGQVRSCRTIELKCLLSTTIWGSCNSSFLQKKREATVDLTKQGRRKGRY